VAQSFTTNEGITLVNPGTYVATKVQPNQGGIASAGVVTLIGEADEGPGFRDEADLSENAFSPDQFGQILNKYKSGRIVDAARAVIAAANDPAILGAVNQIRIVKTNHSAAAAAITARSGFGDYAAFTAKRRGTSGNLIKYKSEAAAAETAPTTGEFAYVPALTGSVAFDLRNNGAAKKSITVTAKEAPSALRSAIEDIALGLLAKGGTEKLVEPAAGLTISAAAPNATTLVVTLQSGQTWAASPAVGDTAVIPANTDYGAAQDSAINGAVNANCASYLVTAVSNTVSSATLTLKRISAGTCVADSGVTSADKKDIILYSAMEVKNATGQDRESIVGVTGTYNSTLNDGTNITIQAPAAFAAQPKAGDLLTIAATFANINAGFYQVSSSTSDTVSAYRLSDGSSGSLTGSQLVASIPNAAAQPFKCLAPVIDGTGKTLTVEGSVNAIFLNKSSGASANLANAQKLSASELKNTMTFSQSTQSESLSAGGEIVITIGCSEEDATVAISDTSAVFSVAAIQRFEAKFSDFKTVKDLADYISSQTNFSASVTLAKLNAANPADLDKGTYTISGLASHKNGRIKRDASEWSKAMNGSFYVSAELQDDAGLPEETSPAQFLSGGSKAGSTSVDFTDAIDAAEKLDTNFMVSLVSVDAAEDIANSETESSSTYAADAVNAYMKSHVIKMSAVKQRKNRIALVSKRDTYSNAKEAAGEMSSFRVGVCFEDVKNTDSSGQLKTFQPWMGSCIAAGMQAAAGYKGIVKKFANISGIAIPYNDFDPNNPGDTEDALKAGLLILERVPTGGFRWVSDQMSYSVDNNFVYNSLQAVYIADLISLTLIQTFDRLIVGQSVAEISASAALAILETEMFNFKRLRWIAASDDAPKGFKNASAKITGPVLEIFVEIKLAGLIYFVPISLNISQVEQTAT
jgi:hypothetical protein